MHQNWQIWCLFHFRKVMLVNIMRLKNMHELMPTIKISINTLFISAFSIKCWASPSALLKFFGLLHTSTSFCERNHKFKLSSSFVVKQCVSKITKMVKNEIACSLFKQIAKTVSYFKYHIRHTVGVSVHLTWATPVLSSTSLSRRKMIISHGNSAADKFVFGINIYWPIFVFFSWHHILKPFQGVL